MALTASPAHVSLRGSSTATVRILNSGTERLVLDVRQAGFALDLRGRPRIVPRRGRSASAWLAVRPSTLALRGGDTATLTVSAKVPRRAEPGDHDALVLLTTRPRTRGALAVRMRLGVVVAVRVPGRVVHSVELQRLEVRRRAHEVELLVVNHGNVTEELARKLVSITLRRHGATLATLWGEPRQLLPRTRGVVVFRYDRRIRGMVSAHVTVALSAGSYVLKRTLRLRL